MKNKDDALEISRKKIFDIAQKCNVKVSLNWGPSNKIIPSTCIYSYKHLDSALSFNTQVDELRKELARTYSLEENVDYTLSIWIRGSQNHPHVAWDPKDDYIAPPKPTPEDLDDAFRKAVARLFGSQSVYGPIQQQPQNKTTP